MHVLQGNRPELEKKAVDLIVEKIAALDKVVLGLVGGSSVTGIYERLFASESEKDASRSRVEWSKVHIFMVDERCVPVTSEESNFKVIYERFLRELVATGELPEENIHAFHFDEIHDERCMLEYFEALPNGKFDIVILGAGEDGHVASLFPNHASIRDESDGFIAVGEAPKAPSKRVSASKKLLEKSDMSVLLFFGEQKAKAYQNFMDDKLSVIECPAKLVLKSQNPIIISDL